jgi:hypothetical protein
VQLHLPLVSRLRKLRTSPRASPFPEPDKVDTKGEASNVWLDIGK